MLVEMEPDVDAEEHAAAALQRQAQAAPDRIVVRREREAAGARGAEDGEPPSGMRASGRPGRPCVSAPSGREEADGRSGGMNLAETFGPPSDDPRHPGGGTLTGRNGTSVFVGVRCRSPSRNAASPCSNGFPASSKQEQRRAERAGKREILGHEQPIFLKVQDGTQGLDHARVGGNPADQRHGQFQRLHTHHIGLAAAGQRVAQPGHDVLYGGALLLEVDRVRLAKTAQRARTWAGARDRSAASLNSVSMSRPRR